MMWNELKQTVVEFLRAAAPEAEITPEQLTTPPSPEKGDFAFPCFTLAKALKKSPQAIAIQLAENIEAAHHSMVEKAAADGGYVNITIRSAYVAQKLFDAFAREGASFGTTLLCRNTKVMIEFSGPNTHKEFHIGHLRNTLIGNALVQLNRNNGCWVLAANYINDFGIHVARCLWALKKYHPNEKPPKGKESKWLASIYMEGAKKLDENPDLKQEVATVLTALEARDEQWFPLFLQTKEWSMNGFREIYKELGVAFDDFFYESDIKDEGKEIVQSLLEKGIAKKSEGAVIVDLNAYNLDVLLVLKSDGNGLYATSDLALAHEKFRRYEVDEAIIVTDVRQSFYFKQLFKTLELIGFHKKLKHVGYELVSLPEGLMASRAGRVVLYDDVRNQVTAEALKETAERHVTWDKKQTEETAGVIAHAAIAFDMLRHDPGKMVVFDAKKAVSFEGFTGPYVQYVYARVCSIFRKKMKKVPEFPYQSEDADPSLLTSVQEKNLLITLAQFPVIVEQARAQYNPALLCHYVYDVAKAFSSFYESQVVLVDETALAEARLALCSMVAHTLEKGLSLLGIPVVQEM